MDDFVVSDEDKFVILQQHVMKLSQKLEKAEDRITMLESLTPTSSPLKNTPTKKLRQKLEIAAEVVAGRQQEDLDEPSSSSSEEETEPTPTPAAVEEPAEPELREAPPKPPPGPGREEERRHRDLEKTKAELAKRPNEVAKSPKKKQPEPKPPKKEDKKQSPKEPKAKPKPTVEWWVTPAKKSSPAAAAAPVVSMDLTGVLVGLLGAAVYCNSLWGEMVFDDRMAIKQNRDVIKPDGDFWRNDFWGVSMKVIEEPITSQCVRACEHLFARCGPSRQPHCSNPGIATTGRKTRATTRTVLSLS